MTWRSIKDDPPPKDGRLVLLAKVPASSHHNVFVAYWDDGLGEFKFHREGYVRNPTLWLPLDALPPLPA
jgi:hypothetical protein